MPNPDEIDAPIGTFDHLLAEVFSRIALALGSTDGP
ncbi:hypothetical protein SAMN05444580_11625 [Rhodococcus tukisamuensis]|uniref:Uncharacterized protein n=1 Tax=Rhodococcus tukisamuensis TaxID=168276 RepID=A0A1G7CHV1_9NOCA|nr:hypothetical protein SAMN05444580_11625 [Rhodococcus tukisamuensis]